MNFKPKFGLAWICAVVMVGIVAASISSTFAGEAKFESQLVWATNDEKPPDANYKPVDQETQKKLESLGLKWKNFCVVKRVEFETKNGVSGKVAISDKSSISVKFMEEEKVEVVLHGQKGEECSRRVQQLKVGKMLVHGGNVPENSTAWLVTLKRIK
ncbi:MAG: hypothetical protein DVB33_10895 [Verrucomicrobia bacterium]|jgi:hypothetical protein|nr:MAG: hypothetical protein DVB33_10895 [Verrucomicrobiota bacterium]